MPAVAKVDLLDQALSCFAERGLQATSIDYLTTTLQVSHRTFYEVLGPKAAAIEAVYAYAIELLLVERPAPPRPGEHLQDYLARWWQHTAAAARAQPRAFRFWQYYRTRPAGLLVGEAVLGPFAEVLALMSQLVGGPGQLPAGALPLPVLGRGLAAQWTAAVEVVLAEPACQASPALGQRVLTQAYASWWQGLGLPATQLAAVTPPRPVPSPTAIALDLLSRAIQARQDLPPKGVS